MSLSPEERWDVAVIGAGPAGLAAAREAASAGASTIVIERAVHPRYKTCGGGLIGISLAAVEPHIDVPSRCDIRAVTFTLKGRRPFTRYAHGPRPLLRLIQRTEFDDALREVAVKAGAVMRQRTTVRAIVQHHDHVEIRLADGSSISAATVVGADGSAGVSSRHVGVELAQADLGLEVEIPVPPSVARRWRDRLLLDWGPMPGSYGWVFPKGDSLTVGVIASKGLGDQTKAYLRGFVHRLGFAGIEPLQDSGHLTRCRTDSSPLRSGRVIVAGDAAGLLEPFTREGISFALRSGALAGIAAAKGDLEGYCAGVNETLVPDMRAGFLLMAAHERRPALFHAGLATPPGWAAFAKFCRGELTFGAAMAHPSVRYVVERAGR
ncbi:MAG TPA: geranylgeranyl reductase family protein [Micromonosporaceae bacterium]|jgi:geranylgeranyl reductase family protein